MHSKKKFKSLYQSKMKKILPSSEDEEEWTEEIEDIDEKMILWV